jgi:hypothetical protein
VHYSAHAGVNLYDTPNLCHTRGPREGSHARIQLVRKGKSRHNKAHY